MANNNNKNVTLDQLTTMDTSVKNYIQNKDGDLVGLLTVQKSNLTNAIKEINNGLNDVNTTATAIDTTVDGIINDTTVAISLVESEDTVEINGENLVCKTYAISQNNTPIATINVPIDLSVEEGAVISETDDSTGETTTYLKFKTTGANDYNLSLDVSSLISGFSIQQDGILHLESGEIIGELENNSVENSNIKDGSITEEKLSLGLQEKLAKEGYAERDVDILDSEKDSLLALHKDKVNGKMTVAEEIAEGIGNIPLAQADRVANNYLIEPSLTELTKNKISNYLCYVTTSEQETLYFKKDDQDRLRIFTNEELLAEIGDPSQALSFVNGFSSDDILTLGVNLNEANQLTSKYFYIEDEITHKKLLFDFETKQYINPNYSSYEFVDVDTIIKNTYPYETNNNKVFCLNFTPQYNETDFSNLDEYDFHYNYSDKFCFVRYDNNGDIISSNYNSYKTSESYYEEKTPPTIIEYTLEELFALTPETNVIIFGEMQEGMRYFKKSGNNIVEIQSGEVSSGDTQADFREILEENHIGGEAFENVFKIELQDSNYLYLGWKYFYGDVIQIITEEEVEDYAETVYHFNNIINLATEQDVETKIFIVENGNQIIVIPSVNYYSTLSNYEVFNQLNDIDTVFLLESALIPGNNGLMPKEDVIALDGTYIDTVNNELYIKGQKVMLNIASDGDINDLINEIFGGGSLTTYRVAFRDGYDETYPTYVPNIIYSVGELIEVKDSSVIITSQIIANFLQDMKVHYQQQYGEEEDFMLYGFDGLEVESKILKLHDGYGHFGNWSIYKDTTTGKYYIQGSPYDPDYDKTVEAGCRYGSTDVMLSVADFTSWINENMQEGYFDYQQMNFVLVELPEGGYTVAGRQNGYPGAPDPGSNYSLPECCKVESV